MATNSKEYVEHRRQKRRKKVFAVIVACVLVLTLVSFAYWQKLMRNFTRIAQNYAEAQITLAVNQTVADVFAQTTYDDFVVTRADEKSGKAVYVSANVATVNVFSLKTAIAVQKALSAETFCCSVPYGTLAGFVLLPDLAPEFEAEFGKIDIAKCNVSSKFYSAGVNQTLHRIFVEVSVRTELLIPGRNVTLEVQVPVLICENILVGDVPAVLLDAE